VGFFVLTVTTLLGSLESPLLYLAPLAPSLGINWAFRIDGLSILMLLLIFGVGSAVFLYAQGYLHGDPQINRLLLILSVFMVAMAGCVTADNFLLLFVFWELTSLTSYLLVGYYHNTLASRKSALQALMVTGSGGLAMLAGMILLGQIAGTYSISAMIEIAPTLEETPTLIFAIALIFVGCFSKSAQFPFHFWLPNAMAAPTPVSAYLHSATMVKLGVYFLARLDPGLGEFHTWQFTLQLVGSLTAAWGMTLALGERDLKRILAWSTVATLGTLTLLVGVPGTKASPAVASLLMAHALYKAPLFFVAGNIDHGTGTRIIDNLGNLRKKMPFTAAAALLAGLSMAGLPLTFGFVAKEIILEVKEGEGVLGFVSLANTLFSAIAVAVAAVAAFRVFWPHPGKNVCPEAHEGTWPMIVPPLGLASLGIVMGVYPQFPEDVVLAAAQSMSPSNAPAAALEAMKLSAMISSLSLSLGIGAAIFFLWDPLHRTFDKLFHLLSTQGMAAQYERMMASIPVVAARQTRFLQNGSLSTYHGILLASTAGVILLSLLVFPSPLPLPSSQPLPFGALVGAGLTVLGGILACAMRQRLVLVLASGFIGYGSAVLFLFSSAPDLAFTQFAVETIFVVVITAVLVHMNRSWPEGPVRYRGPRPVALIISLMVGLTTALAFLAAVSSPMDTSITDYFSANSLSKAYGRNVVNVVIVDFRALDTLGEGMVVLVSLLAAVPLFGLIARHARKGDQEPK
jgi:multicomponent Na+:H+ antiporter subunit A